MLNKLKELFGTITHKEELGGGLLGIGEKDTDFLFGSSIYDRIDNINASEGQIKYEYNQGAQYETRNWCTVYSAITELSYLMNYRFSKLEIIEIGHKMIDDGKLNPDRGAYLADAIDAVRHYWNNKFPSRKIESYRIDMTDIVTREILENKSKIYQIGYATSPILYNDCQDDGHADLKDYKKLGGHAVSKKGDIITDNYFGKHKRNSYSFTYFDDLVNNGVVFRYGYIFLKAENNNNINNKTELMEQITLESAKLFAERGYTNGERPTDNITRQEMWAIMERVISNNNLK